LIIIFSLLVSIHLTIEMNTKMGKIYEISVLTQARHY